MKTFSLSKLSKTLFISSGFFFTQSTLATVVSSIHPIGFITEAITDGVVDHKVVAPSSSSPHDYAMKPSDLKLLNEAELVIWVDDNLEAFLVKPMANKETSKQLKLADVPEIAKLIAKEEKNIHDDTHNEHEHEHEHEHGAHVDENKTHDEVHKEHTHDTHANEKDNHEHPAHDDHQGHDHSTDWHIWMSPDISILTAQNIASQLISIFPDKKEKIETNLAEFTANMQNTVQDVSEKLKNVKDKPYYVFHDAYGYYEDKFGLHREGEFTINPTIMPGVQQLTEIKNKLKAENIHCIFKEPQFSPNVINAVIQGTEVKVGELDPVGGNIQLSKNAYFEFLNLLADSYISCLK